MVVCDTGLCRERNKKKYRNGACNPCTNVPIFDISPHGDQIKGKYEHSKGILITQAGRDRISRCRRAIMVRRSHLSRCMSRRCDGSSDNTWILGRCTMSTHTCSFCDHTERRATDLSLHVITTHGIDFRPSTAPRTATRPVSCWSCAKPIMPAETHCECGLPKPDFRHTR